MTSTHDGESPAERATNAAVDLTRNDFNTTEHKTVRCAFCQKLPAVCKVERLRIRAGESEDFVKVHLPYCGVC